jgi:hypothetical protein
MNVMKKKYIDRFNIYSAVGYTCLSAVMTLIGTIGYCNPVSVGSEKYMSYYDNLEGFCKIYDNVFVGFFIYGDNEFFSILFFSFLIVLVSFIFEAIVNIFREYTPYEVDPEISVIKIIGERLGQVPFIMLITWLLGFLV